jgi:hypothetical protein
MKKLGTWIGRAARWRWLRATALGAVFGAVAGLLVLAVFVPPLAQGLIDSDDDGVVLWTIRYFKWTVAAFWLLCCAAGATIGRRMARSAV